MLGSRMTNADEEEVEEELAALEAEVSRVVSTAVPLPSVPDTELPAKRAEAAAQEERQRLRSEGRQMLSA